MAWSIGWDVPAQEPQFSDCSEVAKIPGSVWPANTKPALWMIWWPHFLQWGSLPPFYTLLQAHKTLILAAKSIPKSHSLRYPAASHSCCTSPQWGNTTFLCFFAQKPSNTHKITLSKPILSPDNAIFQWVSHFKVPSAWTAAHSRVCSSSHPSQEKLHTLKTPSRARLRSLNLLHMEPPPSCVATPLVKRNLEQFMVAECP